MKEGEKPFELTIGGALVWSRLTKGGVPGQPTRDGKVGPILFEDCKRWGVRDEKGIAYFDEKMAAAKQSDRPGSV